MAVRATHLDAEQLRELYPDVVRVASRIVGADAAEDVAQETFLRLMAVSKPRRPRAWLAKVARNLAIDEVRRRKHSSPVEAPPDTSVDTPDVPELLSVRRAMQDLPDRYRLVLWLKHVEGRSAAEIARMTGVTQSSVEMSLFRARRSLADSYTKRAGLLSPIVAFLAALRRYFAHGATAAKITVALVAAVGVVGAVGLHPPRTTEVARPARAGVQPAVVPPGVIAPGVVAAPAGSRVGPTLAAFAAASPQIPLPIDQVISQARTIIVGVVREAQWQQSQTAYELRTEDVWYGAGRRNGDVRFALNGHPWIGRGMRVVVFLSKTNDTVRVRRDGALFDAQGHRLRLTFSQLEARIRGDHANRGTSSQSAQSREDDDSTASPAWSALIAALLAPR